MDKLDWRIVLVLTLIYAILSFIHFGNIHLEHISWVATNPNDKFFVDHTWNNGAIFDEMYYASSAYQDLHNLPPYVDVHPPLGMLLIAVGIIVFGMTPFGWRFIPNLASILLLPIMYNFAKHMFKDRNLAVITTLLIMCEFMHFTIGRLAFLEAIVTLFLVLEYYFLFRYIEHRINGKPFATATKYLYASGIFLGLAMATKLNALFSIPAILIWLIYCEVIKFKPNAHQLGKIILELSLIFIIIPLGIYILSYIPYAIRMHSINLFSIAFDNLQHMYQYQTGLAGITHPYASSWWSWPLLKTPISIYYDQDSAGIMSTSIVLMGNPAIYWMSIPAILILAYTWWRKPKDYIAAFILIAIFAQYLPFAFIHRLSFLYYFYPATPFIILGIVYALRPLFNHINKVYRYIGYSYIALNLGLFAMYFPVLTGLEIPRRYTVQVLLLLKNWNF